ncbi:hypothetical protein LMG27198_31690 [Methylocystis echinoides]|uniref:DUF2975 domain-containing protein n=2 Tax=Methylocystis echinoides TaxID=29468 RepID=A0A9W6LT57_9HYPH|nr:hypothetical protein LMG27198_31690 [Methylocystis echinoides]
MKNPSGLTPASVSILQKKIGRICNLVRWAGVLWYMWLFGVFLLIAFNRPEYLDKGLRLKGIDPVSISDGQYWSAHAVLLVVFIPTAVVVWRLWGLMQGYREGDILTVRAADRLRAMALAGFVAVATDIIAHPIAFLIASPLMLSKTPFWQLLNPVQLFYALMCGFLLALSVIFRAAVDIADDNAQII